MCLPRPFLPIGLAALAVPTPAQVRWARHDLLPRVTAPVAFDLLRDRLVLLTAAEGAFLPAATETWEWDGTAWQLRHPTVVPSARQGHAMVYDAIRARVVVFGGTTATAETWEWDGTDWTNPQPATSPPPRSNHAMAYDLSRGRTVVFGGERASLFTTFLGDTWTWDGTTWTQIQAIGPAARSGHGLAFDLGASRTVMFGGRNAAGFVHDTWTFDGTQWQLRTPARQPPARSQHGMTYDLRRSATVVFGGQGQGSRLADTWEWDGTDWTQNATAAAPSPRANCAMAYDPGRGISLLSSGSTDFAVLGDLWRWSGAAWNRLADAAVPPPRHSHAATFDPVRSRLVVFAGSGNNTSLADHWEWDGSAWSQIQVSPMPPGRAGSAMVFDTWRGRAVLFGGDLQGSSNDLWEWDGSTWVRPATPVAPPPRTQHAMVFDSVRGRCVLFGGVSALGAGLFDDTWEWDGLAWTMRAPPQRPAMRGEHAMAFDSARRVTVLFSGYTLPFGALLTDTWEWDGTNWMFRAIGGLPGGRRDHSLTFDAARGRVVLFGGNGVIPDTWEWDGSTWRQRAPASAPPGRGRQTLDYDPVHDRVLLFGGQSPGPNFSDLWEYGPLVPATFTAFGNGCAGTVGLPSLAAASGQRPWLGEGFTLAVRSAPHGSFAIPWLGLSRTAWGAFALPLPLAFAGMPNCDLATSIDRGLGAVPAPQGIASVTIQVPADPALLAATLHAQAAVTDPAANPAGLTVTNAGTLVLGGR